MRSRASTWMVLAVALSLLAAACNGETEPTDEPDEPVGGEISIAAVWTGGEHESFQLILDAFTAETGISTNYTSTGDDIAAFLGTQIEGGRPPDIALLPQPGLLVELAGEGSLQPLGDEVASELAANFAPVWSDLGSVDGTLYGVYFKAANKSTWWYNVNVFADAGVSPPATWDEMLDAASTTNAFGVPWTAVGGASGWVLTDWFENIYLRTAGPEMYDALTNHEIPWTDDSVIEALEVFADVIGDPANLAGGREGALQNDFDTSVTLPFTDPPQAATIYEGDFVGGIIRDTTDAEPETDFDFFDFPAIEGSPPAVMGGGDVAVALTDNPAAQEFLAYLATPEAVEPWAERGGFTSPNQNLDPGVYPDELTARAAVAVAEAEVFRFDMSDLQPPEFGGTEGRGMWGLFQDFLSNPDDVQGVAEALEEEASAAFD